MSTITETSTITVAHSPDSDDAFMFYGLATDKLDTGDLKFTHVLKDIQTLNEEAFAAPTMLGRQLSCLRLHSDKYILLPHGASIGDNYGPILVSRDLTQSQDISGLKIAVPGTLTSAFLALKIFNPDFQYEVVPFDKIIDAVKSGGL